MGLPLPSAIVNGSDHPSESAYSVFWAIKIYHRRYNSDQRITRRAESPKKSLAQEPNYGFFGGNCYGFQFEPQLTLEELEVWNRELAEDYHLMGDRFDPAEEAARNLREFTKFAPIYQAQMRNLLQAFLRQARLE